MQVAGTSICLATLLLTAGSIFGQCQPVKAKACTLVLQGEGAPSASPVCASPLWKPHLAFLQQDRFADANEDGWFETVLRLALDPADGCSCAVFRIEYGEVANLYTVNIGDSPTNDGYGGDEASTRHDAELMIRQNNLELFSSELSRKSHRGTDNLLSLKIPDLPGHTVELEICNQFFRFAFQETREGEERWEGRMHTGTAEQLFALGPTPDPERSAARDQPDPYLYAAFNRVIHHRAGPPSENRFGAGVRKVVVFLNP